MLRNLASRAELFPASGMCAHTMHCPHLGRYEFELGVELCNTVGYEETEEVETQKLWLMG